MRRSREYPEHPLVGVGALIHDGGKVLLIKRKFEPNRGRWSLPGGLLETGETIEEGALREVREELGVEVKLEGLLDVAEEIIPDEEGEVRFHYLLLDFLASLDRERRIVLNGESSAYRWFDPKAVIAPRANSSAKTKALVRKYLATLGGSKGAPDLR